MQANLAKNQQDIQASKPLRFFSAGLMVSSILMAGCAVPLVPNNAADTPQQQQVKSNSVSHQKSQASNSISLDGNTMFEIMAAEMMMQKGQAASAFEIFYPLALKTNDKGLAERTFQVAMASYNVVNIEKATVHWKKVSPESILAWRASFLLTLRKNDVAKALEEWDTYYELSQTPINDELIGTATKVAGSVPKEPGTKFFQALTQKYSDEWAAYYGLGMVSSVYQNPEVGIAALKKAEPLLPKADAEKSLPIFYNLLSKLYLMGSEPLAGIETLEPYLEKFPNDLLVQERVARLEVKAKLYADAEKRYESILKIEPDAQTSLLSLSLIQMELDKTNSAEQNLIKLKQYQAYESVASYYLGILYQDSDRSTLAEQMFKDVQDDSYLLDAKLHLAEIYFEQKNLQKSMQTLDSIKTNTDVDKIKVLRAKAIFTSATGNNDEAIAYYNQALTLDPDNVAILKAQSLLLYNSDRFEEYESNLLKVLKLNENDADVLNALGYFYVEKKIKLDQAYDLLNKALSLQPQSYYILDSLGWYFYQVKEYAKAIEYLNKAFEIEQDEEVLIHLVSAYWQNNEVNRAKSLWKKYHKNFLQNERVQNLINELEIGTTK